MNPKWLPLLALRLSIPVATGWGLAAWMRPWPAFGLSAATAVLLSAIGVLLLVRAPAGEVTWRNYVAGWLLPWGYRLASGRLFWIGVVSAAVFTAIAGGVILAVPASPSPSVPMVPGTVAPATVSWLLIAAWIVDGAALLHVVSTLPSMRSSSSAARALWKLGAVAAALLVGSVALLLGGYPMAALWLAGGPPLAIGAGYGLFVLLLVTVGRNERWN